MGSFLKELGLGVVVSSLLLGGTAYLFRGALPLLLGAPAPDIAKDTAAKSSESTGAVYAAVRKELEFPNRRDFEFAERGFVATREDPLIRDASDKVVQDLSAYGFVKGEAPATVNPSLWR